MADPEITQPEDAQPEGTPPSATEPQATQAAAPQFLTREELDTYLQHRDQAILGALQATLDSALSRREASHGAQREAPEAAEPELTKEDFYADPVGAMKKFFEMKVAPMRASQAPRGPDPVALQAFIATQKQELRSRVGEATFAKYEPGLNAVMQRTDPRVLADPQAFDALWRLTVSYVDDEERKVQGTRSARVRGAALESASGAGAPTPTPKAKLTEDQAYVAQQMGLSAEDFEKYARPEEIDYGTTRR